MGEHNGDILNKHPLTLHQIISIVVFAVMATFSLTSIYDRFESVETTQITEKEYTDAKFKNLQELINQNYQDLKKDIQRVEDKTGETPDINYYQKEYKK